MLKELSFAELGLNRAGVCGAADQLSQAGQLPVISIGIGNAHGWSGPICFGDVKPDSVFLTASLTKPVLAMAMMQLVARGEVSLEEPAWKLLPQFPQMQQKPLKHITLRHLLSHASGLVDQPPDGRELRKTHASLMRFAERAIEIGCDFQPGTALRYQSMGYGLIGLIIEELTGMSCAEFLRKEIFEPLEMKDASLGMTPKQESWVVDVVLPPEQIGGDDWNWNSRWWREFGAPWGGMLATLEDVAKFASAMLRPGDYFSPAVIREATRNAAEVFPNINRERSWCLGWRPNWIGHRQTFGDLLTNDCYGHWGATGTLLWIDPEAELFAVLLSNQPMTDEPHALVRVSNAIVGAFSTSAVGQPVVSARR